MIYHFGKGEDRDLELAQIYYERAMKEESKALAPVYLLSLFGKWQRLDLVDTVRRFFGEGD
jgi:TPR repeat protein